MAAYGFQSVPKLVLAHFGGWRWDWILRWLVEEFKVSQSWCWLVAGAQEVPVLFLLVGGFPASDCRVLGIPKLVSACCEWSWLQGP